MSAKHAGLDGLKFTLPGDFKPRFGWWRTLPLHLQMQSSECGLACLAMVCGYYGNDVGLPSLRQSCDVSAHGVSLDQLAALAETLNMQATALEVATHELGQLTLPAVLHWRGSHYVVLEKLKLGGARIADPAQGKRWISRAELERL